MRHSWGTAGKAIVAAALLGVAGVAFEAAPGAQQQQQQQQPQQGEYTNNFRYNSGQGVQPIFEGWSHAPDGGFNMHFGYLNRNYVEQPHIPIGPSNTIDPGGPDRGQPTFFDNRTQRNLFTVHVPKDWPLNRDVVWTLSVNGKTEKAFGWLRIEWEIDPAGGAGGGGGSTSEERKKNQPPTLAVDAIAPIKLPAAAKLVATITDDGLPKPRPGGRRGSPVGQETPPTLRGGTDAPVNVPAVAERGRGELAPGATAPGAGAASRPQGPSVAWSIWRGPADANFSRAEIEGDKRIVTATFTKPGEYVLRAVASDTQKTSAPTYVKLVVQ